MVKVREDLSNKYFGKIKVVKQAEDYVYPNGKHSARWLCQCYCGNLFTTISTNLKNGKCKSCGCFRKNFLIEYNKNNLKKHNKYDLTKEYGIGWTTNTNHEFYFDLEDYDKIKEYTWFEHKKYAATIINKKRIKMHQLLGFKKYDHIDRNSMNNCKSNLRKATQQNNARNHSIQKNNTSGITGVTFSTFHNKWKSYIYVNKKRKDLGSYKEKEKAIKARLEGELKYFGIEFAPQRHLFKEYNIF